MLKGWHIWVCSLGLLLVLAHAVSAAVLFADNFDCRDSFGRLIPCALWGNEQGNWMSGGGYSTTAPSSNPPTYTSANIPNLPELKDFVLDVDVRRVSDGGIWLRSHRCGNGHVAGVVLITGGGGGHFDGLYWHIWDCNGWGPIYSAVSLPGQVLDQSMHLKIVVQSDTYAAYLNYAPQPTTTLVTTQYPSGKVALYSNSSQYFDNVVVQTIPSFFDNFEQGAQTEWGNEQGNWVATVGLDRIYYAQAPNNNPPAYTSIASLPGLRNFVVEVDIRNVSDGGIWLRSRRCDNGQVEGVLLVTGGGGGRYNGLYWHIWDCNGWGPSYAPVYIPGLQGSPLSLRIEVVGDTYKISRRLYGLLHLLTTFTTNRYFSGRVALYDNSSAQSFDNVSVQPLPLN